MKLVVFDLDQTLVDVISLHDEAVRRLFVAYFGVDARLTEIDFAGRSLTENLAELARLKGVPQEAFERKAGGMLEEYETTFAGIVPADGSQYVLPGARRLLQALSKLGHVVALYTGSSPGIVARVFEATGLGMYFRFCFYGTDVAAREDMVRLAIAKAEAETSREFKGKDVVIVGDSTRDVECGKRFDALTIAVATGFHTREQLLKLGPDYLFDSLDDHEAVLKAIEQQSTNFT